MKKILSVVALSGLMVCGAMTSSYSEGTNEISILDVETTNTVTGDITSENNSTVKLGDTDIENTNADKITVDSVNETGTITAKEGGEVKVGNASITNSDTGEVVIDSKNKTGEIKATKGTVDVGNTKLDNVTTKGKINVRSDNTTQDIEATNGGKVGIGNTSITNMTKGQGNVDINQDGSKTVIGGKVTADGAGSTVDVANVKIDNVDAQNVTVNTNNKLDKEVTATGGSTVAVGTATLKNLKSDTVTFKADNHVTGAVKSTNGSKVSVGNLNAQ